MSVIRSEQGAKANCPNRRERWLHSNDCKTPSKWSQDFRSLIDDYDGYKLFEQYLEEIQFAPLLKFWCVLRGFKREYKNKDVRDMFRAANVIYKQLFKPKSGENKLIHDWVKEETKNNIATCLRSFSEESCKDKSRIINVFVEAQRELEERMRKNFYDDFLRSEIFLNYVQKLEIQCKPEEANSQSSNAEIFINELPKDAFKPLEGEKSSRFIPKTEYSNIQEKTMEGTLPSVPKIGDRMLKFLNEKLCQIKKEKEKKEKDEKEANYTLSKMRKLNGERFSGLPPQLLLDAMKDKLTNTSGNDASDQSILDEHISRVFSPDNSPITRSRSEVKPLPSNSLSSNPPLSRDDYIIDGLHSNVLPNDKYIYYPKKAQMNKHEAYKWSVTQNCNDSEQINQENKAFYRNRHKPLSMQRAFGDGISTTNLNVISEESSFTQRRQEFDCMLKSLPTPMYPSVVNDKFQSKVDATLKATDILTVGYRFAEDEVPYVKKLQGCHSLTLAQFKQLIPPRKGPSSFYFRKESNEFGTGYVMEEIFDDNEFLPIIEGKKIYCVIDS
ncbi:hypothetical protein B4U79_01588, partial [Dinothrombium tinctorium]